MQLKKQTSIEIKTKKAVWFYCHFRYKTYLHYNSSRTQWTHSRHNQMSGTKVVQSCTWLAGETNYLISWTVARCTGSTRSILEIRVEAVFGMASGVWYIPARHHTQQCQHDVACLCWKCHSSPTNQQTSKCIRFWKIILSTTGYICYNGEVQASVTVLRVYARVQDNCNLHQIIRVNKRHAKEMSYWAPKPREKAPLYTLIYRATKCDMITHPEMENLWGLTIVPSYGIWHDCWML